MPDIFDATGKKLPDPETFPEGEEPIICWAIIIKNKTDDGMVEVSEGYKGARIAVNLRSVRFAMLYNKEKKLQHGRLIIYKINEPDEFIPLELLDVELNT